MIHFERKTIHFFLSIFHILKNLSILMPILILKTIQSTLIHENIFDEKKFFFFLFDLITDNFSKAKLTTIWGWSEVFDEKNVISIFFNWKGNFFNRFQKNLLISLRISHYSIFEQTFSIFLLKWYIETPRITI